MAEHPDTTLDGEIRALSGHRFSGSLAAFVRAAAALDEALGHPAVDDRRLRRDYDRHHAALLADADAVAEACARTRPQLSDLRLSEISPRRNGSAERTRRYFHRIKAQQIELLFAVADEVEIIRTLVDRSGTFRLAVQEAADPLMRSARMLAILRDRFASRPSTVPRLRTEDQKLRPLDEAIDQIRDRERRYVAAMADAARQDPVRTALAPFQTASRDAREELVQRRETVAGGLAELGRGWKLLRRLMDRGYSWRIKGSLETLLRHHDRRRRDFARHLIRCRQNA
jgi:hypothetical protein